MTSDGNVQNVYSVPESLIYQIFENANHRNIVLNAEVYGQFPYGFTNVIYFLNLDGTAFGPAYDLKGSGELYSLSLRDRTVYAATASDGKVIFFSEFGQVEEVFQLDPDYRPKELMSVNSETIAVIARGDGATGSSRVYFLKMGF